MFLVDCVIDLYKVHTVISILHYDMQVSCHIGKQFAIFKTKHVCICFTKHSLRHVRCYIQTLYIWRVCKT